jgi:hypothetical protein
MHFSGLMVLFLSQTVRRTFRSCSTPISIYDSIFQFCGALFGDPIRLSSTPFTINFQVLRHLIGLNGTLIRYYGRL